MSPLIALHLTAANSSLLVNHVSELSGYMDEVAAWRSKSSGEGSVSSTLQTHSSFIDLMSKFFIHVSLLVNSVIEMGQSDKLNVLFDWSSKHSHELLIDSISTSHALSNTVYQHPLTSLDKKIENFVFDTKEETQQQQMVRYIC